MIYLNARNDAPVARLC